MPPYTFLSSYLFILSVSARQKQGTAKNGLIELPDPEMLDPRPHQSCQAAKGHFWLPVEFEGLVSTGTYFGSTQHLASALHNM